MQRNLAVNEPEPDAPVSDPAWQTPVLVPLIDINDAAGKPVIAGLETTTATGPS